MKIIDPYHCCWGSFVYEGYIKLTKTSSYQRYYLPMNLLKKQIKELTDSEISEIFERYVLYEQLENPM